MNISRRDKCPLFFSDVESPCEINNMMQCSICEEKVEKKVDGRGLNSIIGYSQKILFEGCNLELYSKYGKIINWAANKLHNRSKKIDFDEMDCIEVAVLDSYENDIAAYDIVKRKENGNK